MRTPIVFAVALLPLAVAASGEVRKLPGSETPLPHDRYIRTVPESESPLERLYIKTRDGLYVAAALRKPKGDGPFPALIHFHGAPGGRGIEQLSGWALGATGSPVFERFLKEGYVVVVADYRGGPFPTAEGFAANQVTYADDGLAVLEYVRNLPYVDKDRIHLYGVSLGGDVVMHMLARTSVRAAILGAGAPITFLRAKDRSVADRELALRQLQPVNTPLLILVGTKDPLLALNQTLHDLLEAAGKKVILEIYENGYHDFVIGPQGQNRSEPLLDSTLAALESTLQFLKSPPR